jgi:benzylsuccinate CoA-transferase BbsF subunit
MVPNSVLPLAGVRVTDFTSLAAGPAASKVLADFGAEDIIIESEAQLSRSGGSRQAGPPGRSPVNTGYFHNKFNPNKLSITVDLFRPEGRSIVRELIAISDIFIANRLPRVLEQFELTYAAVREIRPDIIYVTMPTMGTGGPRSFYSGVSWGIQAMAGLNMISGFPDRPPSSPSPFSHPDVSCNPLHTAVAVLAALRYRGQTGRGQQIELSQYESTVCWTGPAVLQYTANQQTMERSANELPGAAPHDVYRCRGEDMWCAISVFTDAQWQALSRVVGRPELADHPDYATLLARKAHEGELRGVIEPWTAERDADEVMQTLQRAGIPCMVLNDYERLLRGDPQLKARGLWTEVEHPELGTSLVEGWGFRLPQTPPPVRRAPLLGEHNDYVFQGLLGMSEEQVNMYLVGDVLR